MLLGQVEVFFVRYPDDCCPQCCVKRCSCFETVSNTTLGKKWWKLRCYAFKIIEHNYFETFIIVMIISSSLALVSVCTVTS